MARQKSRPIRWAEATAEARRCLDALVDARDELQSALSDLGDIKDEYEEWYDNMPEALQEGTTGEKLQELLELDLEVEVDLEDYEEVVSNAENADLPLGFGRD